jgi:hypothetical protein
MTRKRCQFANLRIMHGSLVTGPAWLALSAWEGALRSAWG